MGSGEASKGSDVLVILSVFATVLAVVKLLIKWKQGIPGPLGFPLLGHLPFLGSNPIKQFQNYRKKYGDIYRIRLGMWPTVIISGKNTVKNILYHNSDSFASRPEFFSFKKISDMKGLTFSHFDHRYLVHRKIASNVVKEFAGVNSPLMQDILANESERLISDFIFENGKPFDPKEAIMYATGSIIYQFCYGRGENVREDTVFTDIIKDHRYFKEFTKAGNPFDVLPWLRFIRPGVFQRFTDLLKRSKTARAAKADDVSKTFDSKHLRHASDGLMASVQKYSVCEIPNDMGLTVDQIMGTIGDFFGVGFDTTATTLNWIFLYMAEYPEVQLKVQKELDENLGFNRLPKPRDREILPYTEATILETMRLSGVVPMGLPHCTTEDVVVNGHAIEKGTVVFFNMYSVGHDKYWENPFTFQPERFIDEDGKLIKERAESVLPFSAGRRRCLGESLARAELLVFVSSVLQKCDIIKPIGESYDFEGDFSLTYSPKPYKICVKHR